MLTNHPQSCMYHQGVSRNGELPYNLAVDFGGRGEGVSRLTPHLVRDVDIHRQRLVGGGAGGGA